MNAEREGSCRALSPRARLTMEALIVTLAGDERELLDRVAMPEVLDRADLTLQHLPPLFRAACRVTLGVFEYLPCLLARKIRPFCRLSLEARTRYAEVWAHHYLSGVRNIFKILRLIAIGSLVQDPAVTAGTGYAPFLEHRLTRPADGAGGPCAPARTAP